MNLHFGTSLLILHSVHSNKRIDFTMMSFFYLYLETLCFVGKII